MPHPTSTHPPVVAWLKHVRVLSESIGPRPPTGEGERKGAEYARDQFCKIGLDPDVETFKSARSIFLPHLIGSGLMLAAFILYPLGGTATAVIAALLSILVLVSEVQELGFQDNFYRRIIPKGESQNVHAIIPPAGEHKQDLVLVGHLDTQRTPFIFRSPKHVYVYDKLTTVFFITFIAQAVLYTLSIFLPWSWVWYATIPTALSAILLGAICIEADSTPFTAGANDNATAVGMVLTLAERFVTKPLQNTRILAVCTGCEEVQHYGMIDFYRRHRQELVNPRAVVFEMLGCCRANVAHQRGHYRALQGRPRPGWDGGKTGGRTPGVGSACLPGQRRQYRDGRCRALQNPCDHDLWPVEGGDRSLLAPKSGYFRQDGSCCHGKDLGFDHCPDRAH